MPTSFKELQNTISDPIYKAYYAIYIPKAIRDFFNLFPLKSWPSVENVYYNKLHIPILHVYKDFNGKNILNPDCLYWYACLYLSSIDFATAASSPSASHLQALPFLELPNGSLEQNISKIVKLDELKSLELRGLESLLINTIHTALLYSWYNEPENKAQLQYFLNGPAKLKSKFLDKGFFGDVKNRLLYVNESIYDEADEAFLALSSVLGERQFFEEKPGLLDCRLFAYTHLILTFPFHTSRAELRTSLNQYTNLVGHNKRIYGLINLTK